MLEEDRLFATLDTTSRKKWLAVGKELIFSDTVGFIRDLPKDLVDAFKSTLDELMDSSLLIHLVDATDLEMTDQIKAVENILHEIGAGDIPRCIVLNKIDALSSEDLAMIIMQYKGVPISAMERRGFDELLRETSMILWGSDLMESGQND